MIKYLLWLLKGKPMVHLKGYFCGVCGKWYDEEFDVPEYKVNWFSNWGMCPKGQGCSDDMMIKKSFIGGRNYKGDDTNV